MILTVPRAPASSLRTRTRLNVKSLALASFIFLSCAPITGEKRATTPPLEYLADSDWALRGRNHEEQHWSPLSQVNKDTAHRLGLAWVTDIPSSDGLISTPIISSGTAYVSGSFDQVFAISAQSGELKWHYNPHVRRDASIMSSWGVRVNRGVAVDRGRVLIGTGDCRLIALDAESGVLLWDVPVCRPDENYAITGAPRVGEGGLVYIGSGGADFGARGFVAAFQTETGEEVWRFYTVPGDSIPQSDPAMLMAAETWAGAESWKNGGGTVWEGMTYDHELDRLYIGVAGGTPWDPTMRSPGGGDNLFLCSIVALDAKTGRYIWHYQTVPGDAWDYDASMPILLAKIQLEGEERSVLMQAPKNGFFYVLDRESGELISADNYVYVNWAESIDIQSGRPIEIPEARYYEQPSGEAEVFPSIWGGHSWQAMSYSPKTGLVYIPALNFPSVFKKERGAAMGGVSVDLYGYDPLDTDLPKDLGKLIAWDPVEQKEKWSVDHRLPFNGGTLATAGGLIFQGNANGELTAFDDLSGQEAWSYKLGSAVQAAPVTYSVGGKQFILIAAGWGGSPRTMVPLFAATSQAKGPSRLFAFYLDGDQDVPRSLTEIRTATPAPIAPKPTFDTQRGALLFESTGCSMCHGQGAVGAGRMGSIPDLRLISKATYDDWLEIVIEGRRSSLGMLSFKDQLRTVDALAIRDFVLSVAWESHQKTEIDPKP